MQDRAAFPALLSKSMRARSTVRKVWLDKAYTGPTVAAAVHKAGIEIEIVS